MGAINPLTCPRPSCLVRIENKTYFSTERGLPNCLCKVPLFVLSEFYEREAIKYLRSHSRKRKCAIFLAEFYLFFKNAYPVFFVYAGNTI